ncbi:MAG TPA: sensor histidine kinase [Vicinamibacterales bacterium]
MSSRAPSQVRVETLIARGRLVLALFSIVALPLAAGRLPSAVRALAVAYLVYAVLTIVFVRTRAAARSWWPGATHALDLSTYAALLAIGGPLVPPSLGWFVFAVVAATLRWGWRGALTTGAVGIAIHVAIGAFAADILPGPALPPRTFVILALLMGVVTVLIGLVGAYEDWRGAQLARLATWAGPSPDRPVGMPAELLEQTSLILEANRMLLLWEEADEPWTELALWSNGRVERFREPPGAFGDVVAEQVRDHSFFCRDLDARTPVTFIRAPAGPGSWNGAPLDERLRSRFAIHAVAAWPLRATDIRGWLFCLDKPGFSFHDLTLGEVVADLAAARLSQAFLVRTMRETAVATERLKLARDLHDGVLQTLTGAALQLQTARRLLARQPEAAEERLSQVQRIIAAGQNDLRFFIQQLGPMRSGASGPVDFPSRLEELVDRIRRQWGVPVAVSVSPTGLTVPDALANDLFLLIHEALVNAARHARASAVTLAVLRENHRLAIAVSDDGQGFPFAGQYTLDELERAGIGPKTLRERTTALGGRLTLDTGPTGTRIQLEVPLQDVPR